MFALAERVRNEYVLKVTGMVRARPPGTANAHLKSGAGGAAGAVASRS